VLGESAARRLGLLQGDRIRLIVPGLSESGRTLQPRIVSVELSHTFRLGSELDYSLAFMDVDDLTAITGRPADLRLTVHDLLEAPLHARQLNMAGIQAHDWTMRYGDFFRAVRMEKIMMFVLLSFVIAVASFSIVSGLSMLVDSKRRDIAVLRTMGMSERGVLGIFVIQGMLVAGLGVFVGLLLGLPLAVYAPEIMDFIYQFFGFSIIEGTYFDRIPTDVRTADVTSVILVALVISFVATLYPAIRAARLDPAAVLRYE
jgi:lipoprotein-releasing system permease protein